MIVSLAEKKEMLSMKFLHNEVTEPAAALYVAILTPSEGQSFMKTT